MALKNIVMATQADRTLVTILTKTIAEQTTQVTSLTAKPFTAQSDNDCLNRSRYRSSNTGTPADCNPPLDRDIYSTSGKKFEPNGCCSSHSFKVEGDHTSATCLRPITTHNTRLNISVYCLYNAGTPADRNPPLDRNIYLKSGNVFEPNGYCPSHSFKVEEYHTSATCLRPLATHKQPLIE